MEQLNYILDAVLAPGILLGMALCLFFLHFPQKTALRNYRHARYIMGAAYLFYALCIYLEYHVFGAENDKLLARPIILTIASFQAYLFTHTLITLLRLNNLKLRKLAIEASIITAMTVALFVAHIFYNETAAQWAFWIYVVLYVALLARYVIIFRNEYEQYASQMDNYFSDEDTRRLHWVKRSFYVSLAVGVLALLYALLPVAPVALVFMAVVIVFYATFAVRFINYALHFHSIEAAITSETQEPDGSLPPADNELMNRIESLMLQDKLYRKCDLSVNDLATLLGEHPRIVSSTINAMRQVNFKTYINDYRVKEAIRLLDEDKHNQRTIDAIASESGFANRSTFYRAFKNSQGISPTDYRLSC